MHEDLDDMVIERAAEIRMNINQKVRGKIINELAGDDQKIKMTAADSKAAAILLATLKDSDTIDIKRLGLKQNERDMDTRERVLSFLANITAQVKGNPFQSDTPVEGADELKGRPEHFYEKDDFVEGELEIGTNLTNYSDFMSSRNAIPSSAKREDNDSDS